jgi:hypothetical protein
MCEGLSELIAYKLFFRTSNLCKAEIPLSEESIMYRDTIKAQRNAQKRAVLQSSRRRDTPHINGYEKTATRNRHIHYFHSQTNLDGSLTVISSAHGLVNIHNFTSNLETRNRESQSSNMRGVTAPPIKQPGMQSAPPLCHQLTDIFLSLLICMKHVVIF